MENFFEYLTREDLWQPFFGSVVWILGFLIAFLFVIKNFYSEEEKSA